MQRVLDEESEDLALGAPPPSGGDDLQVSTVTARTPRSAVAPRHHRHGELFDASESERQVLLTNSLATRLGDDLSDHLRATEWLDRHPSVGHVMDDHPELIDIMTELIRERRSLQQALTSTQHEMKRRQQEQHEHVQYLEELSTDQIEKAKHELTVARQAEILQNFATEINPDDTVDLMSKQLQEKELLMRHMVNEQNKLKQQLADKEQQHADNLRNVEDGQQKLLHEVDALRTQLVEVKTRSLRRRKRFGGETASRPSSMLLEQLSNLASEKADEAEKLRSELLSLQRRHQDLTDMEQHTHRSAVRVRSYDYNSIGNRGSALFDYGLDLQDVEHSGRSDGGDSSLHLPIHTDPRSTLGTSSLGAMDEDHPSVVNRFVSQLPSANMDVSQTDSFRGSTERLARPPSPLALDDANCHDTVERDSTTRYTTGASHDEHVANHAVIEGAASLKHKPVITLDTADTLPADHAMHRSNLVPVDTVMLVGPDNDDDLTPTGEQPGRRSSPASTSLGAANETHDSERNVLSTPGEPSDSEEAAVELKAISAARLFSSPAEHLSGKSSHRGNSEMQHSHLMTMLSISYPDPIDSIKVYRSKSCPRLESIIEKDSTESVDGPEISLDVAASSSSLSSSAIPITPGPGLKSSLRVSRQYATNDDTDSGDDEMDGRFRSHSYGGRGESNVAKVEISAAVSRINWLPVLSPSYPVRNSTPRTPSAGTKSVSATSPQRQLDVQLFNIAVVGPSGVGKTSFVHRFGAGTAGQPGPGLPVTTIGVDFVVCTSCVCGADVTLKVWDTAGAERFRSLTSNYLRRCDGIILMFDVGDRSSFHRVKSWYELIADVCRDDVVILMLGNKVDLANRQDQCHAVTMAEAISLAQEMSSAMYLEVSATEGYGVSESCAIITTAMLGRLMEDERKLDPGSKKIVLEPETEEETSCCS